MNNKLKHAGAFGMLLPFLWTSSVQADNIVFNARQHEVKQGQYMWGISRNVFGIDNDNMKKFINDVKDDQKNHTNDEEYLTRIEVDNIIWDGNKYAEGQDGIPMDQLRVGDKIYVSGDFWEKYGIDSDRANKLATKDDQGNYIIVVDQELIDLVESLERRTSGLEVSVQGLRNDVDGLEGKFSSFEEFVESRKKCVPAKYIIEGNYGDVTINEKGRSWFWPIVIGAALGYVTYRVIDHNCGNDSNETVCDDGGKEPSGGGDISGGDEF